MRFSAELFEDPFNIWFFVEIFEATRLRNLVFLLVSEESCFSSSAFRLREQVIIKIEIILNFSSIIKHPKIFFLSQV